MIDSDSSIASSNTKIAFYCYAVQHVNNQIESTSYRYLSAAGKGIQHYPGIVTESEREYAEFHLRFNDVAQGISCLELSYCEDRLKYYLIYVQNTPAMNAANIEAHNAYASIGAIHYNRWQYLDTFNPPQIYQYEYAISNYDTLNVFSYLYGNIDIQRGSTFPELKWLIGFRQSSLRYFNRGFKGSYYVYDHFEDGARYINVERSSYEIGDMDVTGIYNDNENLLTAYFYGYHGVVLNNYDLTYHTGYVNKHYTGYFTFYHYLHRTQNMDVTVYAVCRR